MNSVKQLALLNPFRSSMLNFHIYIISTLESILKSESPAFEHQMKVYFYEFDRHYACYVQFPRVPKKGNTVRAVLCHTYPGRLIDSSFSPYRS